MAYTYKPQPTTEGVITPTTRANGIDDTFVGPRYPGDIQKTYGAVVINPPKKTPFVSGGGGGGSPSPSINQEPPEFPMTKASPEVLSTQRNAYVASQIRQEAYNRGINISTPARQMGFFAQLQREPAAIQQQKASTQTTQTTPLNKTYSAVVPYAPVEKPIKLKWYERIFPNVSGSKSITQTYYEVFGAKFYKPGQRQALQNKAIEKLYKLENAKDYETQQQLIFELKGMGADIQENNGKVSINLDKVAGTNTLSNTIVSLTDATLKGAVFGAYLKNAAAAKKAPKQKTEVVYNRRFDNPEETVNIQKTEKLNLLTERLRQLSEAGKTKQIEKDLTKIAKDINKLQGVERETAIKNFASYLNGLQFEGIIPAAPKTTIKIYSDYIPELKNIERGVTASRIFNPMKDVSSSFNTTIDRAKVLQGITQPTRQGQAISASILLGIKNVQKNNTGQALIQRPNLKQGTGQITKQSLKLNSGQTQRQAQRQSYNFMQSQAQRPAQQARQVYTPGFKIPKPKNNFIGPLRNNLKISQSKNGFYKAELRRKGRFFEVGQFKDPLSAEIMGKKTALSNLGASIRVKDPMGRTVRLKQDAFFKTSKKDPFILVQKRNLRLGSKGERLEIKQSRKKIKLFN